MTDLEGIWTYASYRIGLKKVGDEYLGFIIKADGVYWTEGQVKFKIKADGSVHYYMRDHSLEVYEEATLLGNTFLEMNDMNPSFTRQMQGTWERSVKEAYEKINKKD